MATYLSLTNELLRRLNEVPLDNAGDGFDVVRNVQALAKDAINNSIRGILQDGHEWPFLKATYTQTMTAGIGKYTVPATASKIDLGSFYLKKSSSNAPQKLRAISFEDYQENYRNLDDNSEEGGIPLHIYQTLDGGFGVTPTPNSAYEVEYTYWTYPADLTLYTDVCIIPERFKHVILDGAMMYLMRFRSNEQSAAVHQQNYEQGIKTMRRLLLDEKLYLRSTVINGRG